MLFTDNAEVMVEKAKSVVGGKAHVYIDFVGTGPTVAAGVFMINHVSLNQNILVCVDFIGPMYTLPNMFHLHVLSWQ